MDSASITQRAGAARVHREHVQRIVVSGRAPWGVAPIVRSAHGGGTVTFLPQTVLAVYVPNEWGRWRLYRVVVRGLRTDTKRRRCHSEVFFEAHQLREAPRWVRAFAVRNRPVDAVLVGWPATGGVVGRAAGVACWVAGRGGGRPWRWAT